MPLGMKRSPDGGFALLALSGWRDQGLQVVEWSTGRVVQTLPQRGAFLGLAFSPDGSSLYASGAYRDVVYRYRWESGRAERVDSLDLAPDRRPNESPRFPAGIALSPDGKTLYVVENLADDLAVVDVTSKRILQRLPAGRYPYEPVVTPEGVVFVSAWAEDRVYVFEPEGAGRLREAGSIEAGYHPSALLLNPSGTRLFVASGSTDRVAVIDTRARRLVTELPDPAPHGPTQGSTPGAMALSVDGTRLFVAEADNNAVAVFDLGPVTSGVPAATGNDLLAGRIPVAWYPTALVADAATLSVACGKGLGTGPNAETGPQPGRGATEPRGYTLGQYDGALVRVEIPSADTLAGYSARVAAANGWDRPSTAATYPPLDHVIYIIKENRTYDQIFGDLSVGDGDSTLTFFPRAVTPNHHALAERFGVYDRFFVNAEVSADGHNWSMAAYTTDYVQKTVPSQYSGRGRTFDYEGTNRGEPLDEDDDVAEPANGYLWNLAQRRGITFRNFGEFVVPEYVGPDEVMPPGYRGLKPFLEAHTEPAFPGYDLSIPDQRRADVWIQALDRFVAEGAMPAFQIVRLPNDHTRGGSAGALSPRAYMADNDLALGRIIEALSRSPFWENTVVFVLEDDSQNGPDHVDSHRSPFLVISPYGRSGVHSRFVNTTDVLATIEELLDLDRLSQFDAFGRPLREIWTRTPDTRPYEALVPETPLDERNPDRGLAAELSRQLDFRFEDIADEDLFNRVLWMVVKGPDLPYPGIRRVSALELKRAG